MTRYAASTTVDSGRSRMEIEKTLGRYGATSFAYASAEGRAMVAFEMSGRQVRFELTMPRRDEFSRTPGKGLVRSREHTEKAWEQACRQRWRALALVIKGKMEAIETGISVFDEEFLAAIVTSDGRRFADHALPALDYDRERGGMPALLPGPS